MNYQVKVSSPGKDFPQERQTPGRKGIWGQYEFHLNDDIEECDFWIVGEGVPRKERCKCPPERTFFFTGEPPNVRRYNPLFLMQFDTVLSCHNNIVHRKVIRSQPVLPWLIGMRWSKEARHWKKGDSKDYDELKNMAAVPKDRQVSVITSDKVITKAHQRRLSFVRRLEKEFGNDLDVFITSGMGLEDKWDAIGRYRYHISIENSVYNDYWTEKVSDSFLGLSFPFYHGCPNLKDYFPNDSFQVIDIGDYHETVNNIRNAIDNDLYSQRLESLKESKRLVLDKHNIFPMAVELFDRLGPGGVKENVFIKPEVIVPRKINPFTIGRNILRKGFQSRIGRN